MKDEDVVKHLTDRLTTQENELASVNQRRKELRAALAVTRRGLKAFGAGAAPKPEAKKGKAALDGKQKAANDKG